MVMLSRCSVLSVTDGKCNLLGPVTASAHYYMNNERRNIKGAMYIYFLTPCLKGNGPNSYSLQELLGTLWCKRHPARKEDCLIWVRFIFFSSLNFSRLLPFSIACHAGSFEYCRAFIKEWVARQFLQLNEPWDTCLRIFLAWSFFFCLRPEDELHQTWRWATGLFPAATLCVRFIYLILFFKDISSWKPPSFSHLWGCNRRRPIKDSFIREDVSRVHLLT